MEQSARLLSREERARLGRNLRHTHTHSPSPVLTITQRLSEKVHHNPLRNTGTGNVYLERQALLTA